MSSINHSFTGTILDILQSYYGGSAQDVLDHSELIQYLNIKTKAANKGSKSRASLANQYAIYVLVEDYLIGNFQDSGAIKTTKVSNLLFYSKDKENFHSEANYKIMHLITG